MIFLGGEKKKKNAAEEPSGRWSLSAGESEPLIRVLLQLPLMPSRSGCTRPHQRQQQGRLVERRLLPSASGGGASASSGRGIGRGADQRLDANLPECLAAASAAAVRLVTGSLYALMDSIRKSSSFPSSTSHPRFLLRLRLLRPPRGLINCGSLVSTLQRIDSRRRRRRRRFIIDYRPCPGETIFQSLRRRLH